MNLLNPKQLKGRTKPCPQTQSYALRPYQTIREGGAGGNEVKAGAEPGRRERSGLKIQGVEGEGGREKRTGRDSRVPAPRLKSRVLRFHHG